MSNFTSIEQSKKLLSLGLNPESADMHYMRDRLHEHLVSDCPYVKEGDKVTGEGAFLITFPVGLLGHYWN